MVVHRHLLHVSRLERCYVIHALRQTPVKHIYNGTHHLTPEPSEMTLDLEHAFGDCHHCAIPSLDDTVLMRVVGHCVLAMHTLTHVVLCELHFGELASTSMWSALNFKSDSPSARACMSLKAAAARSLVGIAANDMYWLSSSTTSIK
jgi:hypothetical protein